MISSFTSGSITNLKSARSMQESGESQHQVKICANNMCTYVCLETAPSERKLAGVGTEGVGLELAPYHWVQKKIYSSKWSLFHFDKGIILMNKFLLQTSSHFIIVGAMHPTETSKALRNSLSQLYLLHNLSISQKRNAAFSPIGFTSHPIHIRTPP